VGLQSVHVIDLRRAVAAAVLALLAVGAMLFAAGQTRQAGDATGGTSRASQAGNLPMSFVPNRGQADPRVRYYAQTPGFAAYFTRDGLTMAFSKGRRGHALELGFVDANPRLRIEGTRQLPGRFNDFTGKQRHVSMPTYAGIVYRDLWPGIDLSFTRVRGHLEYALHVAPGADLGDAKFRYRGADRIRLTPGGSLALHTSLGVLKDAPPVSHQQIAGRRVPVESRYALSGGAGRFGIEAPRGYDHRRALVVDPILAYATFLGGDGYDQGWSVAVDAEGSAYVTGESASSNFPTTPGAFDRSTAFKAFVTKLTPDGSDLVYSTALGGNNGISHGYGIAVDQDGNAYVTGDVQSTTFPTTPGAFDRDSNGGPDTFITKLSPDGSTLEYSTYLGGPNFENAKAIAVDAEGNAYVTGLTDSFFFPVNGYDTTKGDGFVYVTKLNRFGSGLAYSTFLGESGENSSDIAVDSHGSAYVTGTTQATNFPTTPGAYDRTYNGPYADAFVTKFNPQGTALDYSTYLGGTGGDQGRSIDVDAQDHAYVAGETISTDFPSTPGSYDTTPNGNLDVFVTKLSTDGGSLVYSTFLGGPNHDFSPWIDAGPTGSAYLTGGAGAGFPYVPPESNPRNSFTAKLSSDGSTLVYSTSRISGREIATDNGGNAYLTGSAGPTFQTTPGAYDTTYNDSNASDAFAAKLGPAEPATLTLSPKTATNTLDEGGHCVTATVGDGGGDPTPGVIVTFTVSGATSASGSQATDSSGEARFCYQGPELPGTDQITASVEPNGPSDTATKTWVIPTSSDGCKVTGEGQIRAQNGDVAIFGANVRAESTTSARGRVRYTDRGPAEPLKLNSKSIDALVCEGRRATIFGQAGSTAFRVELNDRGRPGRVDTFRIVLGSGYDSGTQTLQHGDITVRE
jgi:hypothetical protein